MNKYYVYRFKNTDEIIVYVGKTKNLKQRFQQHKHLTDDISTIEYIECTSEAEMAWKEIYYINLFYNEFSTNVSDVYINGKMKQIKLDDVWNTYNEIKSHDINSNVSTDEYNEFMASIPKYNYKELIHILDNEKLNIIGKAKYALSRKWFSVNADLVDQLKKHMSNYFANLVDNGYSGYALWTTHYNCKNLLKNKGYIKGFTDIDQYHAGMYAGKTNLAYVANIFYKTNEQHEITEEQYALYSILRFLLQSDLYYGKHITIYIPSRRMRELLIKWINEQDYSTAITKGEYPQMEEYKD